MSTDLSKLLALELALEHILKATPGEELEYLDPGEKAPEGVQIHTTQRGARGYYPSDITDSEGEDAPRSLEPTEEREVEAVTPRAASSHAFPLSTSEYALDTEDKVIDERTILPKQDVPEYEDVSKKVADVLFAYDKWTAQYFLKPYGVSVPYSMKTEERTPSKDAKSVINLFQNILSAALDGKNAENPFPEGKRHISSHHIDLIDSINVVDEFDMKDQLVHLEEKKSNRNYAPELGIGAICEGNEHSGCITVFRGTTATTFEGFKERSHWFGLEIDEIEDFGNGIARVPVPDASDPDKKVRKRINYRQLLEDFNKKIFVHELGHVVGNRFRNNIPPGLWAKVCKSYYESADMFDAYVDSDRDKASKGMVSKYSLDNVDEFFAECYAAYITDTDHLQEKRPELIEVFDKIATTEWDDMEDIESTDDEKAALARHRYEFAADHLAHNFMNLIKQSLRGNDELSTYYTDHLIDNLTTYKKIDGTVKELLGHYDDIFESSMTAEHGSAIALVRKIVSETYDNPKHEDMAQIYGTAMSGRTKKW